MTDGPISELINTEIGHRPSHFKKLYDALPVFCADKNYGGLDEGHHTRYDEIEGDFMPAYPNATIWSHTQQIQVFTVAEGAILIEGSLSGEHVATYKLVNTIIITDANLQKQLLSKYERNSKLKSQEYTKFLQDKSLQSLTYFDNVRKQPKLKLDLEITMQMAAMKEGFSFC